MTGFTRVTLGTIRRNAGKMPLEQIARDCGVAPGLVERIARDQGIDLRIRTARAEDQDYQPSASGKRARGAKLEQVTVHLQTRDIDEIANIGSNYGVSRNTALRRIVENARARGLIDDLVRLPAPARGNHDG